MLTSTLDAIRKQYDPTWKALSPRSIDEYEKTREDFQITLGYFHDLLEILPPPRDILELACGSGIAAVELARLGYRVTGLDCSSEALNVARTLEQHAGVKVLWIQDDMRYFKLDEPVDYILLWDVVFGIFASPQEDFKVLERISNALHTGGRCLFQFYNKAFATQHGIEDRYFYVPAEDVFILDEVTHDLPVRRIKLYSDSEWQSMLLESSMKIVRFTTSKLLDDPETEPSRVNYLVAEKI